MAAEVASPTNTITVLQSTSGPIKIVANDADGSLVNGLNVMHIRFENSGDKAATEVEFQVNTFGAPVATIEDVGTFAKDAVVDHSFVNVGDSDSSVAVVGVKYADGSEWSAKGQQPFVTRRQAATLAPVVPDYLYDSN
jgi:hypothetical protein